MMVMNGDDVDDDDDNDDDDDDGEELKTSFNEDHIYRGQ